MNANSSVCCFAAGNHLPAVILIASPSLLRAPDRECQLPRQQFNMHVSSSLQCENSAHSLGAPKSFGHSSSLSLLLFHVQTNSLCVQIGILPYAGVDIMTFELLKEYLLERYDGMPPPWAILGAGMTSSSIAQFASYPLALVRTRMQVINIPIWPQRLALLPAAFLYMP